MNTVELTKELSDNFIDFSYEANSQRAFADARDGLKPGQRACLWEMFNKGYSSSKPHVKSAKISGGVIASWWPHGDQAIYDTFARMSQSWINNIPEVSWHGANGSIQISGEPASSRYTEARLSKEAEEGLLFNIKKHNVPMKLNFSEDDEWPEVFPAIMPRLMINGCQGIGSTIANVWLPHNGAELVSVIKQYVTEGTLDYSNLYPDFPTGGIIINKDNVQDMYKTGKGKVILRARAEIKGNSILITEIPYQTYIEPLIDDIKKLIVEDKITNIDDIINKSDKTKLLIEIICDSNPAAVLQQLYKYSDLEKNFSANQFALVGKTPKLLTLKEYLDIYINHNYECIIREYNYDLEKAKARLEIVEGLIKALAHIDEIISLIKKSNSAADATNELINQYQFTLNQAKAIVDMKLGRLAKLEGIELNNEKNELTSNIKDYNDIITNKDRQKEIFLDRLLKFSKKYLTTPRKTEVTQISVTKEDKEVETIPSEDCIVVMTQNGEIKRISSDNFKPQNRNGKGVKRSADAILSTIATNTIDNLMLFSNLGKMYKILVNDLPIGTNISKGQMINNFINLENGEKIVAINSLYRNTKATNVIFITKQGQIKKTKLEEYNNIKRGSGIIATKFREGDTLANIVFLDDEDLILITKNGMGIHFSTKDISAIGRMAIGVRGIKLNDGDEVISALPVHKDTDYIAIFNSDGNGKKMKLEELPIQKRDGKGIKITGKDNTVASAAMVCDNDNILLMGTNTSLCISAKEIPVVGRTSVGNIMIKGSGIESAIKL